MARYSPIAPISILEQLLVQQQVTGEKILGNYLLFLAHDVLAHPQRYTDLVAGCIGAWPRPLKGAELLDYDDLFIIMDNSVIETGKPLSFDNVEYAARVVGADCIIAPDMVGDMEGTLDLIDKQYSVLSSTKYPLMLVPQGETFEQLTYCVDWLLGWFPPKGNTPVLWGIPRWLANQEHMGTRKTIIRYINIVNAFNKFHLLGMSHNLSDDIECTQLPNVMGIDSANPVVMGVCSQRMSVSPLNWIHLQRGNFWESNTLYKTSIDNIRYMHELLAGE